MPTTPPKVRPCLWFDDQAQEAAEYYTSLIPDSRITHVSHYGEAGPGTPGSVMVVEFELGGQPYVALNGGPVFTFNEAVSVFVTCADQAEVDRYWDTLISDGGQPGPCGWLKDRYGLSWQIVPARLLELQQDPDPARAARTMQAMLRMHKLDVAALEAAADGQGVPAQDGSRSADASAPAGAGTSG